MEFPEKIDKLLKDHGIKNLRQLASEIEIPYTTLWDYYSNPVRLEKANLTYIKKIAKRLDCTVDYLVYNDIKSMSFDNAKLVDIDDDSIEIPVLGRIPAGMPFEAIEDQYTIRKEKIPLEWLKGGKEYFALELDGDSMEPEYHDKDIVIFLKSSDCESGQDCCVRINGFDATFKRIKKQENGIMIVPLNEENSTGFHSKFYTSEDIQNMPIEIIGVVKQIRRNI